MRCSAVSLVGGGDHSILPSPGGPVLPQPARKPWPGPPRAPSASQDPGLQPAHGEGPRCVVWVAGERWAWQGWLRPAVTGGLGRGPLGPSPAIHQCPPLPSWVLAQVKGITKIPAVQTGTPPTLRECLEFSSAPSPSPLELSRRWHFPPAPGSSGMFRKSSFNVRIHLRPPSGAAGLVPVYLTQSS